MPMFTPRAQTLIAATQQDESHSSSAQLPDGSRVVVYNVSSRVPGTDTVTVTPYARFVDAAGSVVGSPVQLFAGVATSSGVTATGVSALPDGTIVVAAGTFGTVVNVGPVWKTFSERLSSSGQILSTTEMHTWTANDAVAVAGGDVHVTPDGDYFVGARVNERPAPIPYYSNDFQRYGAGGNAVGSMFLAGTDIYDFPSEAVLASGNILTASWFVPGGSDPRPDRTFIDVYAPDGTSVTHQVMMTDDSNEREPSVAALGGGRGLIVWHESPRGGGPESMRAEVVDGSGNIVRAAYTIALPSGFDTHLTSLSDGGVLASWKAGDGSWFAQYVDANGDAAAGSFAIGSGVTEITPTADGGFLVESSRGGDVFEQKFDAGPAAASGGDIDVNGGITTIPSGNYDIHGGAGLDQIAFAGAHTQYAVTRDSVSGPEGTDTLSGIERVRFGDGYAVALDVTGNAGQAWRLYQAAFDRAPDLRGLGFQTNDLDMGYSLVHVAQNFIDSPEFQGKYGPGLSNEDFITLLYRNVLDREPEAAGLQYHMDEFAHGDTRAEMLTHFSESPENQANVTGQISGGMLFVPYA